MASVLETDCLSKAYGRKWANRDITLSVGEGKVFGLLGQNGAGKSTLVKSLVGLVHPSSGDARILGRPLGDRRARSQMGFLPENFRYHEWLTAGEVLNLHAGLCHIDRATRSSRIPALLSEVGLGNVETQRVRTFSKGMQQRLGLACALVGEPKLVFLDEPTSALDPIGRRQVREIIVGLRDRGTAVFLNSHLLSEVEMVCDHVAFIRDGAIARQGSLEELLEEKIEVAIRVSAWADGLQEALGELGSLQPIPGPGAQATLHLSSEGLLPRVARAVLDHGVDLYALTPHRRSLEELFVELVEGGR